MCISQPNFMKMCSTTTINRSRLFWESKNSFEIQRCNLQGILMIVIAQNVPKLYEFIVYFWGGGLSSFYTKKYGILTFRRTQNDQYLFLKNKLLMCYYSKHLQWQCQPYIFILFRYQTSIKRRHGAYLNLITKFSYLRTHCGEYMFTDAIYTS